MAQDRIDSQKFAELVVAEFPELANDFREWDGLEHLQMMEFLMHTERATKVEDWATVERCLRLADTLFRHGDKQVKNAINVSYLEHLPRDGEVHGRIREMMSDELRKAWDDLLAYLSRLLGNRRPRGSGA